MHHGISEVGFEWCHKCVEFALLLFSQDQIKDGFCSNRNMSLKDKQRLSSYDWFLCLCLPPFLFLWKWSMRQLPFVSLRGELKYNKKLWAEVKEEADKVRPLCLTGSWVWSVWVVFQTSVGGLMCNLTGQCLLARQICPAMTPKVLITFSGRD